MTSPSTRAMWRLPTLGCLDLTIGSARLLPNCKPRLFVCLALAVLGTPDRVCAQFTGAHQTTPGAKASDRHEPSRAGFAMIGIFDSGEPTLVCSQLRTGVFSSSVAGFGLRRFTDQSLRWTVFPIARDVEFHDERVVSSPAHPFAYNNAYNSNALAALI